MFRNPSGLYYSNFCSPICPLGARNLLVSVGSSIASASSRCQAGGNTNRYETSQVDKGSETRIDDKPKRPASLASKVKKKIVNVCRRFWKKEKQRKRPQNSTGLKNLGNTCYMNSVLQCLAATELLHSVDQCVYISPTSHYDGDLLTSFVSLMQKMWEGNSFPSLAPVELRQVISGTRPDYALNLQQDAHDFFTTLIDGLHAETNRGGLFAKVANYYSATSISEAWTLYKGQNNSPFADVFCGMMQDFRLCSQNVNHAKTSFEVFTSIHVPIPKDEGSVVQLESCISAIFKTEILDDAQNLLRCDGCSEKVTSIKYTRIVTMPKVLVINLKRFTYNEGSLQKTLTEISIPNKLSFKKHQIEHPEVLEQSFQLYAILYHLGDTPFSGHYVADCKWGNVWHRFSDETVTIVPAPCECSTRDGYIAFYVQVE